MRLNKFLATSASVAIIALGISACSNEPDEITQTTPAPEPSATVSESPSPSAEPVVTPTADSIEETEGRVNVVWGDEEDLEYTYEVDLAENYDEELVANFEDDMNNITHFFWSGSFTQFLGVNDIDNDVRAQAVREYMTDEAYNSFLDNLENDPGAASAVLPYTTDAGEMSIQGEVYKIVDDGEAAQIFLANTNNDVLVRIDEENGKLMYERYVNVRYFMETGEQFIVYQTVTYNPAPGADGHWVIDGVSRYVNDIQLLSGGE